MVLAGKLSVKNGIYIEPYLQNPGRNTMTILWWTNEKCAENFVEYGSGKTLQKSKASNEYVPSMKKYLHEAHLTKLTSAALYKYRVRSDAYASKQYTFRTATAADKDFSVAILGDGRTDNDKVIKRHRRVLEQAGKCDIIFEIGDMVYDGSAKHWLRLFRQVLTASDPANPGSTVASNKPYLMAVGNHEIYMREKEEYAPKKFEGSYSGGGLHTSMARFKAFAANPANNSKNNHWEERYYAFKYGAATFIVLDTNNTADDKYDNHDLLGDADTPSWHLGSEQYKWLIKQLKKAHGQSVFTFVLFHPSPYSRGVHGTAFAKIDSQRGYELRMLDPVFREYGVDAVISSHDHHVEHCLTGPRGFYKKMDVADPKNLNYIGMGNSGQSSRKAKKGWEKWMTIPGSGGKAFYTKWYYKWGGDNSLASFVEIQIKNNNDGTFTAVFEIVRSDGKRFNKFSIKRQKTGESIRSF